MGYPTISGALASIVTKFGGDVLNVIQQLLSGINVGATDSTNKPQIDTDFRFRTGRLRLQDATTPTRREVNFSIANQSADRTVHVPPLDTATQDLVFTQENARLFNKTLDAADNNIFANIPASALASGLLNSITNVGSGSGVFKNITGNAANLKTLLGGSNVSLSSQTDTVTINANPASLGGFLPMAADLPSQSTVGLSYLSIAGGNASTTLANRQIEIGMDMKVTTVRARVQTNSANGNLEFGIVDDGVVVAKVVVPTGQTGHFEAAIVPEITIAAGSQIAISANNLGSSGTYEARPICIDVVTGIPASNATLIQVPDWTVYMEAGTMKARKNSDGTVPYTSTTNIMSILNSILGAISAGAPTVIEIGSGVFPATTGMTQFPAADLGFFKIMGQGPGITTIQLKTSITGNPTIFDFQGAVSGSQRALTANGVLHAFSVTVSAGDWALFAVGDWVLLRSTKDWITSGQGKQGEIKQIFAKPSSGVIQFDSPLQDTYNTSDTANIIKLDLLSNVFIENLTIKPESTSYTQTGSYVQMQFCKNSKIKNVEVYNMPGSLTQCVYMRSCVDSHMVEVHGIMEQNFPLTGSHPYCLKFSQANQNCSMDLCVVRGPWRHLVASEGSTASNCEGACRGITIENCFCMGVMDSGFDTHENGEGIQFVGCTVMGGAEHGFNIRSPSVQVKNCQVFDCEYGIYMFQDADDAQIIGNYVKGCDYGIRFSTGIVGALLEGNEMIKCQGAGVYLTDNDDSINIVNNRMISCNLGAANAAIYDTSTAGNPCLNIKVINNRMWGNNRRIRMSNHSTGWQIFDNQCQNNTNASQLTGVNRLRANTGDSRLQDQMIPTVSFLGPPRRAEGAIIGRSTDGTGLLKGITQDGTGLGDLSDASYGRGQYTWWGTGTTAGTVRGERTTATAVIAQQNPSLFCRFTFGFNNVIGDVRLFIGFKSAGAALVNSNDPLNNLHGIGLQLRPTNTDFRICSCDGGATDSQQATSVTPTGNTLYTFWMYKIEGSNTWHWEIYSTSQGDVNQALVGSADTTATLPGSTTGLHYIASIINVTANDVFLQRIDSRISMEYM